VSVKVKLAVRLPTKAGVNVTLTVHVPFTGSGLALIHELLDIAKSPGLVPIIPTQAMVKGRAVPLFRVTVWAELVVPKAWLPKVRGEGEMPIEPVTPMPLRLADWELPAVALSVILKTAERLPVAVGLKVTVMVQFPPAVTEPSQLLVSLKSPGLLPVREMLEIVKVRLPVLLRVTV